MGVARDFSPRWGTSPYCVPSAMTHPSGMQTPVACSSLLTRLRKKTLSSAPGYEEQDSGFFTPGSAYLSCTPDTTFTPRGDLLDESRTTAFAVPVLDFLSRLGSGDYFPVLSKIFGYLGDEDLASASRVCKQWNRVINGNMLVRNRLKAYLNRKISNAENELEVDISKTSALLNQRPPPEPSNKGLRLLTNITNVQSHSSGCQQASRTPRDVPNQIRFNLFRQEGEKLGSGECLSHCPRCDLPAKTSKQSPQARCVNQGCEYVYCTACLCPYSVEPLHSCVLVPPTTPRSRRRYYTVGSKHNRANLKRLLR